MRPLLTIILGLAVCTRAFAGATSQLYTGDAVTVPPGQVMVQSYYDSTFGGPQRAAGGSLTFGATPRLDAKLGYGHLWNNIGPDVRLGPNFGMKWRFVGDGTRKLSVALSSLWAINSGIDNNSHKNDWGGLLIVQYPIKPSIFLANIGRVWIGDNDSPDLRYFALAAARFLSQRMPVAVEYSNLEQLSSSPRARSIEQIVGAVIYVPNQKLSYSAQLAYQPLSHESHFHLTLGISAYL